MRRLLLLLGVCVFGLLIITPAFAEEKPPAPIVAPTAEDKALAARVIPLAKAAQGTLGQESANIILNGWPGGLVPLLSGEKPATADQLSFARSVLGGIVAALVQAPTWPHPKLIKVPHAKTAPVIDGKLDDPAWKHAVVLKGAYPLNSLTVEHNTTWRMLWDAHYLYIGVECLDSDLSAPVLPRDGAVYNADCIEFFIMPDAKTRCYWELEFGITGSIYDALNVKAPDQWGGKMDASATMKGLQVATVLNGTANDSRDVDKGYTMEVAVPINELPGLAATATAVPGMHFDVMLARMDKTGDKITAYACVPLLSWFHNIWNYCPVELKK